MPETDDTEELEEKRIQMFKTRLLSGIVLVVIALILVITGGNVLLGGLFVISAFSGLKKPRQALWDIWRFWYYMEIYCGDFSKIPWHL